MSCQACPAPEPPRDVPVALLAALAAAGLLLSALSPRAEHRAPVRTGSDCRAAAADGWLGQSPYVVAKIGSAPGVQDAASAPPTQACRG